MELTRFLFLRKQTTLDLMVHSLIVIGPPLLFAVGRAVYRFLVLEDDIVCGLSFLCDVL